jgi:hypothetical protein
MLYPVIHILYFIFPCHLPIRYSGFIGCWPVLTELCVYAGQAESLPRVVPRADAVPRGHVVCRCERTPQQRHAGPRQGRLQGHAG